jgi:signal transduction histidine kinase
MAISRRKGGSLLGPHLCPSRIKPMDPYWSQTLSQSDLDALSALLQTSRLSASSLDVGALSRAILEEVVRLFDAEAGGVFVADEPAGMLRLLSYIGTPSAFANAFQTIPLDRVSSPQIRVLRSGEPLLLDDLGEYASALIPASLRGLAPRSAIIAPLIARNRAIGTIGLAHLSARRFQPKDLSILAAIGQQIGVAIDNAALYSRTQEQVHRLAAIAAQNAQLNHELEWKARQLQAVAQVGAQINSARSIDQLAAQVVRAACELVRAPRSVLLLHDPSTDEMAVTATHGVDCPTPLAQFRYRRDQEWIREAWETGRPTVTVWPDEPLPADIRSPIRRPLLLLPLRMGEQTLGLLGCSEAAGRSFSQAERDVLACLANQAAVAVANVRLLRLLESRSRELEAQVAARTAELEAALEQAREADRSKTEFLSTIAHELRTPLAAIKGFCSTLLQDDVEWPPHTQREFLSIIDQESDRLADMVDHLLDFSRLEAGALEIQPVACQLADIIARISDRLHMLAHKHVLIVDIPADLPLVRADPQRIGQVLSNLVENATKYAPAKTSIIIGAQADSSWVTVSVRDQGCGIAPEFQERVFERFFRIRTQPPRPGAGLGLAICRGIIEAHGGRIWVESTVGQGSTFRFTLPVADHIDSEESG